MRPSGGVAWIDAETRSFDYESGAVGPAFSRAIAVEAPVQIVIGGSPFAIMMATPTDLDDFAYGFALSEGIADRIDDIRGVEATEVEGGWRIAISLKGEQFKTHLARRRAMSGRTGCGLCGIEDFDQMPSPRPPLEASPPIDPAAIRTALAGLEDWQPLNRLTRAVHCAAWCARDGRIVAAREDVGRHNALDKTIGALRRAGIGPDGFFVITSRSSFEMVAKAAGFGATTLVSVSAPTSLALESAKKFGLTLIAVARLDGAVSFGYEMTDLLKS